MTTPATRISTDYTTGIARLEALAAKMDRLDSKAIRALWAKAEGNATAEDEAKLTELKARMAAARTDYTNALAALRAQYPAEVKAWEQARADD